MATTIRLPEEARARDILVVDDDRPIREALKELLESEGYTVQLAENGASALRLIRQARPALMLLDLMMPVLSGFELLEMLEDGDPDLQAVPIFIISAFGAPETKCKNGGGVKGCLSKPVDADELLDAVRHQVGSSGAVQSAASS